MDIGILRPGGISLTRHALELCAFAPGSHLADIGCGKGITVAYLREAGFAAMGLDIDAGAIEQAGAYCQVGNASALPYDSDFLDGILYECSLSPLEDKGRALAEGARVLKRGGQLIISDLYAWQGGGLLTQSRWEALVTEAGFKVNLFEDRRQDLKSFAAQLLWEYGRDGLEQIWGCPYDKSVNASYFLLLAAKERP